MAAKAQECRARVVRVGRLAAAILEADLRMEEPPHLTFDAGQWVSVRFGPKVVRAYTIASTPRDGSVITLTADVTPGGIGSEWFRALAPGHGVSFKAPLGGFTFDRADARQPLFVAEEIGIVPIRSILADLDETGSERPATLIYGARDPGGLAYHGEFVSRARRAPAFAYHPVVEQPTPDWDEERGPLVAAVERRVPEVEDLVAYVAGGEETIKRLREILIGRGLERKAFKWERFW